MQAIFGFILFCVLIIGGCSYSVGAAAGVRKIQQEAVNKHYGYYTISGDGTPAFNWK